MLIDKEIAVNVFGAEAEQQPEYKRLYGSSSTNAMVWKDGYVKGMLNVYNSAQQEVSAYKEELASLKEENAKLKDGIKAFLEPSEKFLGAYCISSFYINQLKEAIDRAKTLL